MTKQDIKAVVVPRDLYYHEVAYVRGLEGAARAMLKALKGVIRVADRFTDEFNAAHAAVKQAEEAGITTGEEHDKRG